MTSRDEKKNRRALALAAMEAQERTRRPNFETVVGLDSWRAVLHELDRMVLDHLLASEGKVRKFGAVYPAAVSVLDAGTMLRSPARKEEIAELEKRVEIVVPPSYRAFVETSNGLMLPMEGQFLEVGNVRSYPEIDPLGSGLMEEFAEDFEDEFKEPGDQEYFCYDNPEQSKVIRPRYAKSALALNGDNGEFSHVGKAMGYALLVREVRFENGEHEVWQQAFEWQNRFPSFAAYFSEIRRTIVESMAWL